jgi:hypothetical protein
MIYTRQDGTYVIDRNGMPYHVIPEDLEVWLEVQDRLSAGEETEQDRPPEPVSGCTWDADKWEWVLPLSTVQAEKHSTVTVERDKRILSGFNFSGHMIQADSGSREIAHQYLTKDIAGTNVYPITWRTMDNAYIQIEDSVSLKLFTDAMTAHVNSHFQASWQAKDQIDNASTVEEVEAIFEGYMNG